MERHERATNDFKMKRGGRGKLRVWQWLDEPKITIRERVNASGGVGYRITLPKGVTGGRVIFFQSRDFEEAKAMARSKLSPVRAAFPHQREALGNQRPLWPNRDIAMDR